MNIHDTNFQKWIMKHIPEDKMLYKKQFETYIVFWRDHILHMFYPIWDYPGVENRDNMVELQNKNIEVVGTHWSKSIEHPCVRLTYKGVDIVFRYNFYDYEIAVIGDIPLNLPMDGLFVSKGLGESDTSFGFFYQGFPEKYQLKKYYEDDNSTFMASTTNHYKFHTFMYILKNEIDKKRG